MIKFTTSGTRRFSQLSTLSVFLRWDSVRVVPPCTRIVPQLNPERLDLLTLVHSPVYYAKCLPNPFDLKATLASWIRHSSASVLLFPWLITSWIAPIAPRSTWITPLAPKASLLRPIPLSSVSCGLLALPSVMCVALLVPVVSSLYGLTLFFAATRVQTCYCEIRPSIHWLQPTRQPRVDDLPFGWSSWGSSPSNPFVIFSFLMTIVGLEPHQEETIHWAKR